MRIFNITLIIGLITLILYILSVGQSFFVPILISIVIWYLIKSMAVGYSNIKIFNHKLPWTLAMIFSFITIFLILWLFMAIIESNIHKLIAVAPFYQEKLQELILDFYAKFNLPDAPHLKEIITSIDVSSMLSSVANTVSSIAGLTIMIVVYVLLILLEAHTFDMKLQALFPAKKHYDHVKSIIGNINRDIRTYLKIKTFISFLTAVLSYIVMLIVGVDFAAFWALLVFALNYIPTIGSIVAVAFPVTLSLVQFDTIYPFVALLCLLTLIQIAIGSILDPRLMGKSLNLSPLVIIISLALWGKVWGVVGMFLCVPIMVIINIMLAKFPKTRPIAIILSSKGEVK